MPTEESTPPPLPPKDSHAHVPATIRLGSNLLGLGLAAPNDDLPSPKISVSAYSSPSRSRLNSTSESSPLKHCSETTTPTSGRLGKQYYPRSTSSTSTLISTSKSLSSLTPIMSTTSSKSGKSYHTAKVHYDDESLSEWGRRRGSENDKPSITPYTPPDAGSSTRKRASGQLLSGFGKGIGRVGSVMRRNTAEGLQTIPSSMGNKSRTWGRKTKPKSPVLVEEPEEDENFVMVTERRTMPHPDDEGDPGIGRPFNVEHDLHVSPSLEDLPPAWLEKLREEGLTDQDLLLIAAARRQQAQVGKIALRPGRPALSEPPKTSQSWPDRLLSPPEHSLRTRGSSTPELSTSLASTVAPNRILQSTAFESTVEDSSELPLTTARISRKNKRLSDQLRIFSQYDVSGGDDWAAGLLSAVNYDEPVPSVAAPKPASTSRSSPEKRVPAALDLSATSRWNTRIELTASTTSATSDTSGGESTSTASTFIQKGQPRTPETAKTIKRIPIPPLLDPSLTNKPLDLDDLSSVPSPFDTWSSSPPLPRRQGSNTQPPLERPKESPPTPPLRTSTDSFGVHHHGKSQSSVDVSLVTPSSAHAPRVDDPPPFKGLSEIALDSPTSLEHYLPVHDTEPRRESDTLPSDTPGARSKDRFSLRTDPSLHHSNPAYSVPESVAPSLPDTSSFISARYSSRCSTPDIDMEHAVMHSSELSAAINDGEYRASLKPRDARHSHLHDDRLSPRTGRDSLALSMFSSESAHEATVHHAYSKVLGLKKLDLAGGGQGWRYTRSGRDSRGGIREEESDSGETAETDGRSEAGYSALDALDDAARRIANVD